MHKEEKVTGELLYAGRIISLHKDEIRLENGRLASREYVTHNGGVCVLALDDDNCVYLVQQFRYPYGKELLEIPAGKREGDEAPIDCAKRELEEEIGMTASDWTFLGEMYPSPGYTAEVIYLYLAKGLQQSKQNLDADEFLDVKRIPFGMALTQVCRNNIKDAKTCVAILRLQAMQSAPDASQMR